MHMETGCRNPTNATAGVYVGRLGHYRIIRRQSQKQIEFAARNR